MSSNATTPDVLAEYRARMDAATEGPWNVDDEEQTVRALEYAGEIIYDRSGEHPSEWAKFKPTAEFIAHSRQDVSALLGALDAVLALADYIDGLADGDKHHGALIRRVVTDALGLS